MTDYKYDELLLRVEKPSRYLGAEVNSISKSNAEVLFLLAFPDSYEVGMSHLGMQILYSILNDLPFVSAQRCFAPWPDRERQLRENRLPLTSLETRTPLKEFDAVGFSLQYELSYTNVLNMLDLAGIPLHRDDRREHDPLIIAGGPCCFNPAPLVDFIDVFVIGEGEEAVGEIAAALRQGKREKLTRTELIGELARIPGIYAPAYHDKKQIIKKRTVADLNDWAHPARPVVPLMQTVHDRIVLEIARGCTRGCRFCQAGMLWRPYRERNTALLEKMAEQLLAATGHDEVSLLSLSAGDYSALETLLQNLMNRYNARRVALALPSLRVESLTTALIEEIRRTRKTSFTLAPEAGTDKMRTVINKGNTAADLLSSVDKVFTAGWKSIKLYFMIGLPQETEEDLAGIVDLAYQALRAAKNRGQVAVSLSTFVPKPHTPFQWHRQISLSETQAKQDFIRQHIRNRNLSVKWHDSRISILEGLFSRGDEKLGALLEEAFRRGCRFDGWTELLRFDRWQESMAATGINPENYLRTRDTAEELPWDNIYCGVSREFLLAEKQKATDGKPTADCRFDGCQNCGTCDFLDIKNIAAGKAVPGAAPAPSVREHSGGAESNYRLTFSKTGRAGLLSHLELSAALLRGLRRSSLELRYSSGFHPHPKISFATATSVGMESAQEFFDLTAQDYRADLASLQEEINNALPGGVRILEIRKLAEGEKDLAQALRGFSYELHLPADTDSAHLAVLTDKIRTFLAADAFHIERKTKGKNVLKNIRPYVEKMAIDPENRKVDLTVRHSQQGSARPGDIITHVLGYATEADKPIRILKTRTLLR